MISGFTLVLTQANPPHPCFRLHLWPLLIIFRFPSIAPTSSPSAEPTGSSAPSVTPTTSFPTESPTSGSPSFSPIQKPTPEPTTDIPTTSLITSKPTEVQAVSDGIGNTDNTDRSAGVVRKSGVMASLVVGLGGALWLLA